MFRKESDHQKAHEQLLSLSIKHNLRYVTLPATGKDVTISGGYKLVTARLPPPIVAELHPLADHLVY